MAKNKKKQKHEDDRFVPREPDSSTYEKEEKTARNIKNGAKVAATGIGAAYLLKCAYGLLKKKK